MKRTLIAAGAAAMALGLPATAALADGYNARPAYMQPKAKPQPKAKAKPAPRPQAKAAPKPHAQRRQVRVHRPAPQHGYAAAHVRYEELETVETSVTREVNGRVQGPYVTYSERFIAPDRGCYPQAPCGYSTHRGQASGHGYSGQAHQGYGAHHGAAYAGHSGYAGHHGYGGAVQPGFHHGPLTGGVGYGVDGGPVYGGVVVVQPGGYGHGFGRTTVIRPQGYGQTYGYGQAYGRSSASASSYSSSQSYGGASYGHGSTYGAGGHGYLGFKPSAFGHGVGTTGYGGFR